MSLRTKLIAFFFLLAVAPLAAIGVLGYLRSTRALHALLERQTAEVAERVAAELRDRFASRESDLLLLAENAETQRLYEVHARGDETAFAAARAAADAYLRAAWSQMARSYEQVTFRDTANAVLYRLGETGPVESGLAARALTMRKPIVDQRARPVGSLVATVRREALLPTDVLESRFGRSGYTMVIDRATGEVVYHPSHAFTRRSAVSLLGPSGWDVDTARLSRPRGTLGYREADTTRVAAFVSLAEPPWTVISSGAVEEFSAPFVRARAVDLVLVMLVAATVAAGSIALTRRATRSLEALTAAADEVGAGNLAPSLPAAGRDEVGRLSGAFGLMVGRVREMLREIEARRHMAAVGEFASQLSHEIRNPLTSIKLNLQRLERDVAARALPTEAQAPLGICLREIERLDRVVRGVLALGRERPARRVPCALHEIVGDALAVVRAQLDQQRVSVETGFRAAGDRVLGEPEHLKAVFLNLFLNAAEAMPTGGRLLVSTESAGAPGDGAALIRVRVADTGGGIRPEMRQQIFTPFYSTKSSGTGFGLPLALRTIEEHGGRLELDGDAPTGAAFVVELPLAAESAP